ncbi:MAG TPA: PhzF family phenazine biosynthesis protein [Nocardioides sp.]|nr:PhzF family phenazine biosynthesis protein [Nocardioides sp.]
MRSFSQVDVFSAEPLLGNPVAVVHDADGIDDEEMARFARWTNLSETTFLLSPTRPGADYRLRIWTPGGELPFAGHPTLGSAHAWLEAGGVPATGGEVVQECGAGLVRVRRATNGPSRLSFAAPPLTRSGPVDEDDLATIATVLRIERTEVLDAAWIDNGPGWVGVLLRDADAVLALDPDYATFGDLKVGAVGPYADGPLAVEVRAFCPGYGMAEDPVTGSLNAGIAQWLAGNLLPTSYVASQGAALGRRGRVHIETDADDVWVGGDALTTVRGHVTL